MTTLTTTLKDHINGKPIKVTIDINNHQILISPEGYGEMTAKDGCGSPIMIESRNGIKVLIWSDINQEEPTSAISMVNALESNRKTETP